MIKHKPNQYGWTANAKGEVVENEVEQAVIKEMLEWRDSGVGPGGVASCMDALGHRPRRGNRWTATSVRNILDRVQAEADEKAGIVHTAESHFNSPSIPGALDEDFTCEDGSTIRIPKGSAEDMRKYGRVDVSEEPYVDFKTNKIKQGKSADWSVEDFKELEARKLAEKRLTVLERAERVLFEDPKSWGNFGDLLYPEVVNAASLMATAKAVAGS